MYNKKASKNMFYNFFGIFIIKIAVFYSLLAISKLFVELKRFYVGVGYFLLAYRLIDSENSEGGLKYNILININLKYNQFFNNLCNSVFLSKSGNKLLLDFQKSNDAVRIRKEFEKYGKINMVSMKFPKKNDKEERQGDLIILKKHNPINNEKGVLLIAYTEALARFAALFNLEKLSKKYQFVFEPSWWGYKNYQILLFYGLNTEIVIQCPYKPDYDFISKIGNNFYPINIGAGDWVDPHIFVNSTKKEKKYDIVMVGNWSKIKRHEVLFNTMKMMPKKPTVALIGYPSRGRTSDDVLLEAKKHHVDQYCTFFENIKPEKVSEILRNSKINLLLSKAEGANRGIYEGIFSGNIIIVYKHNKGVNLEQIKNVGFLTDDYELKYALQNAIENYNNYDTRAWGLLNTGCINSTNKINNLLKDITVASGKIWENDLVCKCNRPNLLYFNEEDRIFMKEEYHAVEKFLVK